MKFKVAVHRIEHGDRVIEVDAQDEFEAAERALDVAGDYEFSCYDAEYEVSFVKEAGSENILFRS